jgi:hypothetical protein
MPFSNEMRTVAVEKIAPVAAREGGKTYQKSVEADTLMKKTSRESNTFDRKLTRRGKPRWKYWLNAIFIDVRPGFMQKNV